MKIKINTGLGEYKQGSIINIEVDSDGIPTDRYWRLRLKDSELDGCIEIVQTAKEIKETKTKSNNKKRVE